jgi:hypothetical protein
MNNHRTAGGNILAICACLGTLFCFLLIVAFSIALLFLVHKRSQSQVDSTALSMASALNKGDRIGELNSITEYSRELVFTSRKSYAEANHRFPHIEPLARCLLEDARDGAHAIEEERRFLLRQLSRDILTQATSTNTVFKSAAQFNIPLFAADKPRITQVEIGYVKGIESNARIPSALLELKNFDQESGYIQPGTEFYLANINARLPAPDSDLDYKFSSIAPSVQETTAPLRLASNSVFHTYSTVFEKGKESPYQFDAVPSAVRVKISTDVKSNFNERKELATTATATTFGAMPPI